MIILFCFIVVCAQMCSNYLTTQITFGIVYVKMLCVVELLVPTVTVCCAYEYTVPIA